MELISDSLLNADYHGISLIVQQCNCVTIKPKGLAQQIAQKLGVNSYAQRRPLEGQNRCIPEDRATPGTVEIFTTNKKNLYVANLYAQYQPGKAAKMNYDTYEMRKEWFKECLQKLHGMTGSQKIGYPYGIGCGLAGGIWTDYSQMIQEEFGEQAVIFKVST